LALFSAVDALTFGKLYGWLSFGMSAVAVLAALIVAHELGHFLVARLIKVRVEKFSIGFGPKIVGMKRGETEYMLSWVPLGGYVKLYGDDPEAAVDDKDSFLSQPVWKRLMVVAAGPVFNVALSIAIITLAAMIGLPESSMMIGEIQPDSPALTAGFKPGDKIAAVNGAPMKNWREVVEKIQKSPGTSLSVEVMRETGEKLAIAVTPRSREAHTLEGKTVTVGQIGITPRQVVTRYSPPMAFVKGVEWTWNITAMTVWSISKLITRDIPADQIAGPIGIMKMAGDVAETGFVSLLMFIALISVNLGILNLLPIPVLDGGHMLFFSIEAALGRPVKLKHQEIAQQIGIFLLLSLMALAFYNDIMRLVAG
jgi:regulator of sigma E protease